MSSKKLSLRSKKKNPIPDTIMLTRHKSSQYKKKLREKDRSIKEVTSLIKNNAKSKSNATKQKAVNQKSQNTSKIKKKIATKLTRQTRKKKLVPKNSEMEVEENTEVIQKVCKFQLEDIKMKDEKIQIEIKDCEVQIYKEFCPDKLKRQLAPKKEFLKPKVVLKPILIQGSSKRKMSVPHKDSGGIKEDSLLTSKVRGERESLKNSIISQESEVSMSELIRRKEEEGLSHEDWLEILTCPSPVWWEDAPDEQYIEEPIGTKTDIPGSSKSQIKYVIGSPNTAQKEDNPTKTIATPNKARNYDNSLKIVATPNKEGDKITKLIATANKPQNNDHSPKIVATSNKAQEGDKITKIIATTNKPQNEDNSTKKIVSLNKAQNEDYSTKKIVSLNKAQKVDSSTTIIDSSKMRQTFINKCSALEAAVSEVKHKKQVKHITDDDVILIIDSDSSDDSVTITW